MKAIIYAGIGLFSVASVYGVVDYYTTQKQGTLDNLYKEPEEIVVTETHPVATIPLSGNIMETNFVNTMAVSKVAKKTKSRKRTIRLEEFSRGRIEEPVVLEHLTMTKPANEEGKKTDVVPSSEQKAEATAQPVVIKKELPRRLSLDQFSRAPLRIPVKKVEVVRKN